MQTKRESHSKYARLTTADKEYIRRWFGRKTNQEIAEHIGCDAKSITNQTRLMGLSKTYGFFNHTNDTYLREHIETMSYRDIAKHYGCHPDTVSQYANKMGLLDETLPKVVILENIEYRKVTDTIHVSKDGLVLHKGKPLKATIRKDLGGRKVTALVTVTENKKSQYYQLSRLVAKGWLRGYTEDKYILYKDGDIHNVNADNLILASEKRYIEFMQRNSGHKAAGIEERKAKLQHVIDEATITLNYFKTGDITPLGKYIEERLYPVLSEFCIKKLYLGKRTVLTVVPDCIGRLYESVFNGACIYNYERWCKNLLMTYKKKGNFGYVGSIPKPIEIIVSQLDIEGLKSKFNNTKV